MSTDSPNCEVEETSSEFASSVVSQKPAFGGFGSSQSNHFESTNQSSQPAFGDSLFRSTSTLPGSSTQSGFGALSVPSSGATSTPDSGATNTLAFGATSTPASGATTFCTTSSPAFGATCTPASGATSTPTFGYTGSAFGASITPVLGSSSSIFSSSHNSALGASYSPLFRASGTPAFGVSATPAFEASTTPSFGVLQGSTFGQSTPCFSGNLFGPSPSLFVTPSSLFESQTRQSALWRPGYEQSAFGGQRGGSRVGPYAATNETDGSGGQLGSCGFAYDANRDTHMSATPSLFQSSSPFQYYPRNHFFAPPVQPGQLESISAMPVYKDKSHEMLRWEDYQLEKKEIDLVQRKRALLQEMQVTNQNTILHFAARCGWVEFVSEIIKLCPEMVAAQNVQGETALHEACRNGHADVAMILLDNNAWVASTLNKHNQSAFSIACSRGHVEIVKLLLNRKWLMDIEEDRIEFSCLRKAILRGHISIVKTILEARPGFGRKIDKKGSSPLHYACQEGEFEISSVLLESCQDMSQLINNSGYTPMHLAAMTGSVPILLDFISKDPSALKLLTKDGETVFHLAVNSGKYDAFISMAKIFKNTNILHQADQYGNTVLHLAVNKERYNISEYIVNETTVDINHKNHQGLRALDLLNQAEDTPEARHMIDILVKSGNQRTPEMSLPDFRRRQQMRSTILTMTDKVIWVAVVSFMAAAYVAGKWAIMSGDRGTEWLMETSNAIAAGIIGVTFFYVGVLATKHWPRKRSWKKQNNNYIKDTQGNNPTKKSISDDSDVSSTDSDVESESSLDE